MKQLLFSHMLLHAMQGITLLYAAGRVGMAGTCCLAPRFIANVEQVSAAWPCTEIRQRVLNLTDSNS